MEAWPEMTWKDFKSCFFLTIQTFLVFWVERAWILLTLFFACFGFHLSRFLDPDGGGGRKLRSRPEPSPNTPGDQIQYLRNNKVTPCLARGGYDLSTFGPKVTQDFPGGAGDLKILVPKSWYLDFGTNILVPRSRFRDLKVRSWLLAPPTTLAFYALNGVSP